MSLKKEFGTLFNRLAKRGASKVFQVSYSPLIDIEKDNLNRRPANGCCGMEIWGFYNLRKAYPFTDPTTVSKATDDFSIPNLKIRMRECLAQGGYTVPPGGSVPIKSIVLFSEAGFQQKHPGYENCNPGAFADWLESIGEKVARGEIVKNLNTSSMIQAFIWCPSDAFRKVWNETKV